MIFPFAVLWHSVVGTEAEVIEELHQRIADRDNEIGALKLSVRLLRRMLRALESDVRTRLDTERAELAAAK